MARSEGASASAMSVSTDSGAPTAAAASRHSTALGAGAPHTHESSHASSSNNASPSTLTATSASSAPSLPSSSDTTLSHAGGPVPSHGARYADALSTLSVSDLASVHQKPCARESLLTGIGAGFGVGGLRFILAPGHGGAWQTRQWRAMSWAVGAFVLASGGAHMFCQRRRMLEKQAMARATALMEEKRRLKREEAERARERRRAELEREESEGGLWKWVGWR